MPVSPERATAQATYEAGIMIVGTHQNIDIRNIPGTEFLIKPALATHIKIQALTQNIRFITDGVTEASTILGFQLAAGAEVSVTVPGNGISISAEANGASVEYMWFY